MATKETAAAAVQANQEDVWNVMKTIYLPRGQENEEQSRFVAVNGRTFMVPKGKDVQVPLPVYEVLMNARMAEEEAFRRAQADNWQVNAHDGMKQRKGQKCPFFW